MRVPNISRTNARRETHKLFEKYEHLSFKTRLNCFPCRLLDKIQNQHMTRFRTSFSRHGGGQSVDCVRNLLPSWAMASYYDVSLAWLVCVLVHQRIPTPLNPSTTSLIRDVESMIITTHCWSPPKRCQHNAVSSSLHADKPSMANTLFSCCAYWWRKCKNTKLNYPSIIDEI